MVAEKREPGRMREADGGVQIFLGEEDLRK